MASDARVTKVTPKKRETFLKVLAQGGSVSKAAAAVRISRKSLYALRKRDKSFAEEWDDALECGTDALEDEAVRRATKGTLKPVFYKGRKCGLVREYSDTLLIFTLKARRPDKFRDKAASQANVEEERQALFGELDAAAGSVKRGDS